MFDILGKDFQILGNKLQFLAKYLPLGMDILSHWVPRSGVRRPWSPQEHFYIALHAHGAKLVFGLVLRTEKIIEMGNHTIQPVLE